MKNHDMLIAFIGGCGFAYSGIAYAFDWSFENGAWFGAFIVGIMVGCVLSLATLGNPHK